jgi:hypothetical protein
MVKDLLYYKRKIEGTEKSLFALWFPVKHPTRRASCTTVKKFKIYLVAMQRSLGLLLARI